MDSSTWLGMRGLGVWGSAIGAYTSAVGQKSQLQMQADIAEINAASFERTARASLLAGQREEQKSRLQTANLKSTQQATFAGRGVDLGEGSVARTIASTDVMGEIDANTIAANAVRSAWGYRAQATGQRNEALGRRAAAGAINPLLVGGSTLLTGASGVASDWYMLNKAGAFDKGTFAGYGGRH